MCHSSCPSHTLLQPVSRRPTAAPKAGHRAVVDYLAPPRWGGADLWRNCGWPSLCSNLATVRSTAPCEDCVKKTAPPMARKNARAGEITRLGGELSASTQHDIAAAA